MRVHTIAVVVTLLFSCTPFLQKAKNRIMGTGLNW